MWLSDPHTNCAPSSARPPPKGTVWMRPPTRSCVRGLRASGHQRTRQAPTASCTHASAAHPPQPPANRPAAAHPRLQQQHPHPAGQRGCGLQPRHARPDHDDVGVQAEPQGRLLRRQQPGVQAGAVGGAGGLGRHARRVRQRLPAPAAPNDAAAPQRHQDYAQQQGQHHAPDQPGRQPEARGARRLLRRRRWLPAFLPPPPVCCPPRICSVTISQRASITLSRALGPACGQVQLGVGVRGRRRRPRPS